MRGALILARRSGAGLVLGAVVVVVGLLVAVDAPQWWLSPDLLGRALVRDTGGFVIALLAAVGAFVARGQGRRQPDAVDGRGVLNPDVPLVFRAAALALASAVGVVVVAAVSIALCLGHGSSTVPAGELVVATASVVTSILVGFSVGWAWRSVLAVPVSAAVALGVSRVTVAPRSTAWVFGWPSLRIPPYYDVQPLVPVLSCCCVVALALALASLSGRRRAVGPMAAWPPALTLAGIAVAVLVMGALGASGPRPVVTARTSGIVCLSGEPAVCSYVENVEAARMAQHTLGATHQALGTWPGNIDASAPRFNEVGIDVRADDAGDPVIVLSSPLQFNGSRLSGDVQTPLYVSIAPNWTSAKDDCGRFKTVSTSAVLGFMAAGRTQPSDVQELRKALGLTATCP